MSVDIVFSWWADLAGRGWVGTLAALWIAALVLPLVALIAIEAASLASLAVRACADSVKAKVSHLGL